LLLFSSVIQIQGINPYVYVDARLADRLRAGWRRPLPVLVRVNRQPAKPWRINLMPSGDGGFYLYLRETIRKASGTKAGDRVTIQVCFDKAYRGGPADPLPKWFRSTLGANPKANLAWTALIPSRKKEILRYFASLKSPAAKTRNLRRAIQVLSGAEARFMARTWKNGK
jgi:hypothetical protein